MLRWANARVSVIKETRLWLGACVQRFVSASFVNNFNQGYASVSKSKVHRQHGHASAGGDAKISVCNAGRQDVNVQFCNGHAKGQFCNGHAEGHSADVDARVIEPGSGKTLSHHASLQTLLIQTHKKAPKASSDLLQKFELLESEQFSLSDAAMLVKRRPFKACSFQQLSAMLQVLKEIFPSAKAVHDIVVGSSNILLEPAELVQQKLKLLYDFQVEEKVVSKLCSRGKVLSLSVESLQQKLMFYKDMGLTVEARNMMFSRGPAILLYSLEKSIQPALHFLESTGLTRESLWNLGGHCPPAVFYMSLGNNLIKKYEYCTRFGFSAKEFLKACRFAGRTSTKNMEECVQYLKDRGFADDDVVSMVKKQPSILCHSPQNIKCKLDFLIFEQKRDMAEIVKDPFCLTLSLQRRMVPRFKLIRELGHSKVYLLSYILRCTEPTFMKRFGKRKESSFSAAG